MKKLSCALAFAGLAAVGIASTAHAEESSPTPTIDQVSPNPVAIGERLTVRGDCAPLDGNPAVAVGVTLTSVDSASHAWLMVAPVRPTGQFDVSEALGQRAQTRGIETGEYWVSAICEYEDGSAVFAIYDGALIIEL